MKVLVTGAGGFIGSQVVRQLAVDGHQVVAVERNSQHSGQMITAPPGASMVAVDLDDVAAVRELFRTTVPDALIHLAWYANPGDYLTSHANLTSLAMTAALVEVALAAGCRKLVLAGSCAEYAPQERPVVESDPIDAHTIYAACKQSAWQIARVLATEAAAELAWGRIFHIHGPGEDQNRLIPWVAGQLAAGSAVPLTDGSQVRDHLHVSDVAAGLVALLAPGATGSYNICSGQPVTLRSVLEAVGKIVGRAELLKFGALPHRPRENMFLAGDSSRLRALGWAPRFGLEEGLSDALRGRF
jgi:dTDP-6-deoxy-L-talose 4-dehydrogenase (NAD+)